MAESVFSRWLDAAMARLDRWRSGAAAPPLAFLGDSHIVYFKHAAEQGRFGARRYRVCAVNGATAVGLRNPNTKTNAVEIFSRFLKRVSRDAVIVMQLGEVDCGFVIWYRAAKYRDGIDEQLDASVAAYFAFVDAARARGHRNFVITGATVPTIQDGRDWGAVANARREVTASLVARTELTRRYNRRLRENAAARALPFIDIWDAVIDPATGLARPEFLNADPLNHHLDTGKAAALWGRELNAVLADQNRSTLQIARASRVS